MVGENNTLSDEALQELEEKRKAILDHNLCVEVIGQMVGNIERMEREDTTKAPAMDSKSRANSGKTQYQIDQKIKAEYTSRKEDIELKYPDLFEVKETDDVSIT